MVSGPDFPEHGTFGLALFLCDGAAWVEGAACGRMQGGGNITGQEDALSFGVGIDHGNGGYESLSIGMGGGARDGA